MAGEEKTRKGSWGREKGTLWLVYCLGLLFFVSIFSFSFFFLQKHYRKSPADTEVVPSMISRQLQRGENRKGKFVRERCKGEGRGQGVHVRLVKRGSKNRFQKGPMQPSLTCFHPPILDYCSHQP